MLSEIVIFGNKFWHCFFFKVFLNKFNFGYHFYTCFGISYSLPLLSLPRNICNMFILILILMFLSLEDVSPVFGF